MSAKTFAACSRPSWRKSSTVACREAAKGVLLSHAREHAGATFSCVLVHPRMHVGERAVQGAPARGNLLVDRAHDDIDRTVGIYVHVGLRAGDRINVDGWTGRLAG